MAVFFSVEIIRYLLSSTSLDCLEICMMALMFIIPEAHP